MQFEICNRLGHNGSVIPVKIQGVIVDPQSRSFAVILTDEVGKRWLPIFIGPFEAQAIAAELESFKPPRPLTHDLIKNFLDHLNVKVVKVAITSLKENTFFASISIESGGVQKEIDSRPSDAIAIALRTKTPILVADDVMEKASQESAPQEDEKSRKLKDINLKLAQAIESEEYEEAAKLRDELRKTRIGGPEKQRKLKSLKSKLDEAMRKEEFEDITRLQEDIKKIENPPEEEGKS